MNILLVCHRVPWPLNDGGNIAMYQLARLLSASGHRVTVFALNTRKHFVQEETLPEQFRNELHLVTAPIDTAIRPGAAFLNLFRTNESYNIVRFYDASAEQRLKELLLSEDFDVVQFESVFTGPYLATVRRYSTAACVLRAHNVEHLIWSRMAASASQPVRKLYLSFLSKRLRKYEEGCFRKMDAILPITTVDEQLIRTAAPGIPLLTIPLGIDLASYPVQERNRESPLTLFHLGSMDWQPNIDGVRWLLEDIWPRIHRVFPELKLHLAGRSFPESLRAIDAPMVEFDGSVPDATAYVADKPVMLVPLRSGSGMRVKIIQGLALGKTVITTTVGAEGIDVTDGKDILIADTPAEFLNRVSWCITHPEQCRSIGVSGRKLVEKKYSNQAIGQLLLPFYRTLTKVH